MNATATKKSFSPEDIGAALLFLGRPEKALHLGFVSGNDNLIKAAIEDGAIMRTKTTNQDIREAIEVLNAFEEGQAEAHKGFTYYEEEADREMAAEASIEMMESDFFAY